MEIAICDDEALCREQLLEHLNKYVIQNPANELNYHIFSNADSLFEAALQTGGFDIYLLDILMPGTNGIRLGQKLREAHLNGKIIYLTSSGEYAIDSYKVKAFNYLLKPIKKEELFTTLDEIFQSVSSQKKTFLIVKTIENSVKIDFESILYAELSKRKLLFHLANGTTIESTTIRTSFSEAVQTLLRDHRFILCGVSIVANLQHITMVNHNSLLFKDTYQVYLPQKSCREVRSVWYDYWFKEGDL